MLSSISKFQQKIWDKWNIRVAILFSLFLQIFLIVSAPSRKRTRSSLVSFIWLAYLLADWAATYCIGLISSNQQQNSNNLSQTDDLMAFWGPFLLLHLGGPDTISAFALEDNELWLRHLFGLVFQTVTAAYIFLLTLPHNTLWLPTTLMFLAGLIKYAERTHALYIAAMDNFKKSSSFSYSDEVPEKVMRDAATVFGILVRHEGTFEAERTIMANNEDLINLVQKAFLLFQKFQGLIVDMIYSFLESREMVTYFGDTTAEDALMLLEIELNFMYEVFYTKTSVIRNHWFWFWGKFVSVISITATIVLFIKEERQSNRYGHGFDKLDVKVTYVLLSGALVLDVMPLFMRFFSDFTATLSLPINPYTTASPYKKFKRKLFEYLNHMFLAMFLRLRNVTWSKTKEGPYKDYHQLSTNFLFRRWSGSISGYNLIKYCLDESFQRVPTNLHPSFLVVQAIQRLCFKIVVSIQKFFYQRDRRSRFKDLLDQWRYKYENPFLKELWKYVFDELEEKSNEVSWIENIHSILSLRGEWAIQKVKSQSLNTNVIATKVAAQLESLKPYVDPNALSVLLESLEPYVDHNEVAAQLERLKPYVDPNKAASQLESLKPYVESIQAAAEQENLKPFMDPIEVAAKLKCLKPYVDRQEVSTLYKRLKPYVDKDKVATQLESLKPYVGPTKAASQLESLKPYVDYNEVAAQFESLKSYVDPNKVAFDESLLLWHIATSLCYAKDTIVEGHKREINGENKGKKDERMKISMLLSDYMLYLLIMQPSMMSVIAGIGQKRFEDTCKEARSFLKRNISAHWDREAMMKKGCRKLMEVTQEKNRLTIDGDNDSRNKSVLSRACCLAKELEKLKDGDNKWEIIASVWVELLSYAASHCRPIGHVQLLSKGGELISFVWLLMAQLGLSTQFEFYSIGP